ncbi:MULTISPECIES: C-GCAxxG-C-C family (seleno)protein [unclassified Saccharicrinis]|uniref:C-GCAxxG-C-C family (seleno)protein n=1 Tax=unclassified Saccharicrinis TaxID=2646859 RepID=UPI003D33F6D8
MKVEQALRLYHGKEGFNCAQAILKTFQQEFSVDESAIAEAKKQGRGKAEGGTCGALHAALILVKDQNLQNKLKDTFIANGGSICCKDIRIAHELSCKECVKLAAKTIQEIL